MWTESNEQSILRGLADNNRIAIETLYRQHYGMVQNFILNNSGSIQDAQDIFQEALLVLYERTRSGDFELHCLIKTYLYAVCKRLWLKKLQMQNRQDLELGELDGVEHLQEDLELAQERDQEFEHMRWSMQELGEPCRSLLESFYLKKKTMTEIASDFGYTNADNAKNQKYKCLMRLKKIFFEHYKKQGL